ncbi:hypothetical protein FV233_08180 [Methylobacterium sp. WL7]|nr:hypothetical protein FV233_08180 [Methylobacterium sp. WL7]
MDRPIRFFGKLLKTRRFRPPRKGCRIHRPPSSNELMPSPVKGAGPLSRAGEGQGEGYDLSGKT